MEVVQLLDQPLMGDDLVCDPVDLLCICMTSLEMYFKVITSVTRLGDLLHFGQLFKSCGNN